MSKNGEEKLPQNPADAMDGDDVQVGSSSSSETLETFAQFADGLVGAYKDLTRSPREADYGDRYDMFQHEMRDATSVIGDSLGIDMSRSTVSPRDEEHRAIDGSIDLRAAVRITREATRLGFNPEATGQELVAQTQGQAEDLSAFIEPMVRSRQLPEGVSSDEYEDRRTAKKDLLIAATRKLAKECGVDLSYEDTILDSELAEIEERSGVEFGGTVTTSQAVYRDPVSEAALKLQERGRLSPAPGERILVRGLGQAKVVSVNSSGAPLVRVNGKLIPVSGNWSR